MKLFERISGNFFLRNIVVFFLLHSATFFQRIAMKKGSLDLVNAIFLYVLFYFLAMFHNMVLYEKFWVKKKYVLYVLLLMLALTVFQGLLAVEEMLLLHNPFPPHTIPVWISIYGVDLSYLLLGFCLYYSFNHFKTKNDILTLQYLRRDLELKQLKEQLNPHFLFNALNNIYSYSLEKNSYSKELILKLGELMRFIITNAEKDRIALWEECTFIENYLAFEKERLGDLCEIIYTKQISYSSISIAPFILFTLVENAFKHGTHSTDMCVVKIHLRADNETIDLETVNPIMENNIVNSTKIGLSNAKRRLELLYPNDHILDTRITDSVYIAKLHVNINENDN